MKDNKEPKQKLYQVYHRYNGDLDFYMAFSRKEVLDDLRRRKKHAEDYDVWTTKFRTPIT